MSRCAPACAPVVGAREAPKDGAASLSNLALSAGCRCAIGCGLAEEEMHTTTCSWYEPIVVRGQTTTRTGCKPLLVCSSNHYWFARWPIVVATISPRWKPWRKRRRRSPHSADAPAPVAAIPFGRYREYYCCPRRRSCFQRSTRGG